MSIFAHLDGLGAVLETCTADSVLAWRREFRPGHRTADTMAEHLHTVRATLSVRPAGVALLTVEVDGKGHLDSATHCFRLQRRGSGSWSVSASSLKEK